MQQRRRIPIIPHTEPFPAIPEARVSFDRLDRCWPLVVEVEGWLLSAQTPFDSVVGYLNGERLDRVEPVVREDVRDTFPWIPHAAQAGFRTKIDPSKLQSNAFNHLDIVGMANGERLGRTHTLFCPDLEDVTPTPTAELMKRVAGHHDAMHFRLGGLKCFGDFQRAIRRHRDPNTVRRLLDWGCGCGRVTVHFLSTERPIQVSGCDIDPGAIAWCREALAPGEFTHVGAWPPLPYRDATFDVILGYSVFTHLTREAQSAWLGELKRILAPGGVLIASVHGEFAASFEWPPEQAAALLRDGILDENPDESLHGIVEQGYYQNTFQTRAYTLREWSKHLEIVEYIEAGINSYQDMVVMRR